MHLLHRTTIACAVLLAAWIPAGVAHAQAPEEPDEPPRVGEIAWEGVQALSTGLLEAHMFTEAPSWKPWAPAPLFSEPTLEGDMERLAGLYRRHGYYEARADYALDWRKDGRRVAIRIHVVEGEPVRLDDLSVEIPDPLPGGTRSDALLRDLPLVTGEVFSAERYGAARKALLARLSEAGFPRAEIAGGAEVDVAARTASVAWRVTSGPEVFFGPVSVDGLVDVGEHVVRRELEVAEGARFSLEAIQATRQRLYDLGLFASVIVRPRPDRSVARTGPHGSTQGVWPVEVRVDERAPRSIRLGGGFGTEDQLRARAAWQHRNFLGDGRKLEVGARYSSLIAALEGTFEQPWFRGREGQQLRLGAAVRRQTEPSFDADRIVTRIEVDRDLDGPWLLRAGHEFEWNDVRNVSDATAEVLDNADDSFVLSLLFFGAERIALDDEADPRRGSALNLSVEPSFSFLGSGEDFLKLEAEARAFHPLWRTVLAARLRASTIDPFGDTGADDVPLVTRLFSGGSNSVRGFDYQRLGPLDADDDPVGGTSLLEGSLELRFPLWRALSGVAFLDAGRVSLDPYSFGLDDVRFSTGTGLRYQTPVGPLRIDWGYVLNPPGGIGRSRFHISVGHAF